MQWRRVLGGRKLGWCCAGHPWGKLPSWQGVPTLLYTFVVHTISWLSKTLARILMLLRRSKAWGAVLQSLAAKPAALGVRGASGAAPSAPGNVEERGAPAEGESLLAYWKGLLDERQGGTAGERAVHLLLLRPPLKLLATGRCPQRAQPPSAAPARHLHTRHTANLAAVCSRRCPAEP